ncbi:transposase [Sorangium sp. So ce341]|uniref:transposase n=1 Tax=Sorangium sp. So ce341 TaxID=3133302 RepID=UPI003F6218BB
MPKRTRRQHSSEQKAALLKSHHLEKVPVSDLCDEQKFQPSLFYTWQRQLFEHAAEKRLMSWSSWPAPSPSRLPRPPSASCSGSWAGARN